VDLRAGQGPVVSRARAYTRVRADSVRVRTVRVRTVLASTASMPVLPHPTAGNSNGPRCPVRTVHLPVLASADKLATPGQHWTCQLAVRLVRFVRANTRLSVTATETLRVASRVIDRFTP